MAEAKPALPPRPAKKQPAEGKVDMSSVKKQLDKEELPDDDGYQIPEEVAVSELLEKDKDDESLNKYKQSLLGDSLDVAHDPNDPRKVIVKNFKIIVQDRPEGDIDLDLNDPDLKKKPYIMKEGSHYKICLDFYVQHEIVTALKFMNYTKRKGIQVGKDAYVVGSYAPRKEPYHWESVLEATPKGFMVRGHYTAKGRLLDDDSYVYAEFDYSFDIKKDWN